MPMSSPPYRTEGPLILHELQSGAKHYKGAFDTHQCARLVALHLVNLELLYQWQGRLLGKWKTGNWTILDDAPMVDAFLGHHLIFAEVPPGWALRPPNAAAEEPLMSQVQACGGVVNDGRKVGLANLIFSIRKTLPKVNGFLHHPIHGDPAGLWLRPPLPTARNCYPYPNLKFLFSAFDLPAPDHAALYIHLLACFHSASLDFPRPILFVDSWAPGRGKSEIGSAFSTLLDGVPTSIPLTGTRDTLTENVVAHLLRGGRVLCGHNLTARDDWNNVFLVSLSTDDGVSQRPKYGKESTSFPGVVVLLNGVYGEFSLHPDVIARLFRVQLGGAPCLLTPPPRDYVREHRVSIIREILAAHLVATPWTLPVLTRFAPFEAAGCSAYAAAFELSHQEVQDRLRASLAGSWGLGPHSVPSLFRAQPEAFSEVFQGAVACRPGRATVPPGARGLGFIFNTKWEKESD